MTSLCNNVVNLWCAQVAQLWSSVWCFNFWCYWLCVICVGSIDGIEKFILAHHKHKDLFRCLLIVHEVRVLCIVFCVVWCVVCYVLWCAVVVWFECYEYECVTDWWSSFWSQHVAISYNNMRWCLFYWLLLDSHKFPLTQVYTKHTQDAVNHQFLPIVSGYPLWVRLLADKVAKEEVESEIMTSVHALMNFVK